MVLSRGAHSPVGLVRQLQKKKSQRRQLALTKAGDATLRHVRRGDGEVARRDGRGQQRFDSGHSILLLYCFAITLTKLS